MITSPSPIRIANVVVVSTFAIPSSPVSLSLPTNSALISKLRSWKVTGIQLGTVTNVRIEIDGLIGGNPVYYEFVETVSAGGVMGDTYLPDPLPANTVGGAITLTVPAIPGNPEIAIVLVGELGFP